MTAFGAVDTTPPSPSPAKFTPLAPKPPALPEDKEDKDDPASSKHSPQVWNLKDADIRAVIQTISMLTDKNFLVDPRVQGNVTLISQKPLPSDELYQVFLSMLQQLNFSAVPADDGIVRIVPIADATALSRQVATSKH